MLINHSECDGLRLRQDIFMTEMKQNDTIGPYLLPTIPAMMPGGGFSSIRKVHPEAVVGT